jgi:hypothetical protein
MGALKGFLRDAIGVDTPLKDMAPKRSHGCEEISMGNWASSIA